MNTMRSATLVLFLMVLVGAKAVGVSSSGMTPAPPRGVADRQEHLGLSQATSTLPSMPQIPRRSDSGLASGTGVSQTQFYWHIQRVDDGLQVGTANTRTMAIDHQGRPHVVYGGDHLFYAVYDNGQWHTEIADYGDAFTYLGSYASLALDAEDRPHISYYDGYHGNLKYAFREGHQWHTEIVDTGQHMGQGTCIAVDSEGNPHIAYYDGDNKDLRYAAWNGVRWDLETVDSQGDVGTSAWIVIDDQEQPHLSYFDATSADLRYATRTASGWMLETVDAQDSAGASSSIALDQDGKPVIGYIHQVNLPNVGVRSDVRVARRQNSVWSVHDVFTDYKTRLSQTSLLVDEFGTIQLVFAATSPYSGLYMTTVPISGSTGTRLLDDIGYGGTTIAEDSSGKVYIRFGGELGWLSEDAWFSKQIYGYFCSRGRNSDLALDSNDAPHMVYHVCWYGDVRHTTLQNGRWISQTVANGNLGGPSITIDSEDRPRVSYLDADKRNSMHASWDGQQWVTDIIEESLAGIMNGYGVNTSIALDSRQLSHVVYPYESVNSDLGLHYAYWNGLNWSVQAIISDTNGYSYYNDLALDAVGRPHLLFESSAGLQYAFWTGTEWLVQTLDSQGGGFFSLALDDHQYPNVSYCKGGVALVYARWDGTIWQKETLDNVCGNTSIALDSADRPAISYWQDSHSTGQGILKYAQLTSSGWITQEVDPSVSVGYETSLALDSHDLPHISYYDYNAGDLKYAVGKADPPPAICHNLIPTHSGSGNNPAPTPLSSVGCAIGQFVEGAPISLVAAPAVGWQVSGWSGTADNISNHFTNSLVMPGGNYVVSVDYGPTTLTCFALTTNHIGGGSNPAPTPANSSDCPVRQYAAGASINLTASPETGWYVSSWTGTANDASTSLNNSLVMPASNHAVGVTYSQNAPTCFTLTTIHTGSGSDPVPVPSNSAGCPTGRYVAGTPVGLTAAPAAGWQVGSWTGTANDASTSTTNSLTMPAADHAVAVTYVPGISGEDDLFLPLIQR